MKILIATKNKDKFRIVRNLLVGVGLEGEFQSLSDIKNVDSSKEEGSIEMRAKQKASCFKEKDFLVVGVDDGIQVLSQGVNPHSKELTDNILSGKLLEVGAIVKIVRAFHFHYNEKESSCLTTIPFKFLGNEKNIVREENKYPLSYVFGKIDSNSAIVSEDDLGENSYYLKYSRENLISAISKILDFE